MATAPEKKLAEFRRSVKTWGFWWRVISTLGLYYFLLWPRNQIVITTRRVNQRRGNVLGGNDTSMSIVNVTDVSLDTPPMGAVFGWGNIEVQSAGSGEAEIFFNGLANAKKLRAMIFDLKDGTYNEADEG
jgi:hypothetical protein